MSIKRSEVQTYVKKAGFDEKGMGEKSTAILTILNDKSDKYLTIKDIAEALKGQGIVEKNVYINRTLWSMVKRKVKGISTPLVEVGTDTEGKTVFAITEAGTAKISE